MVSLYYSCTFISLQIKVHDVHLYRLVSSVTGLIVLMCVCACVVCVCVCVCVCLCVQFCDDVVMGMFPVSQEKLLKLAALRLQYLDSDFTPGATMYVHTCT